MNTKIIKSTSHNPYINLALEEHLFNQIKDNQVVLYLWQNNHTVVIGRNQNPWKECDWEKLEADGGYLARRLSGGGAVYHDLGNVNFTFLLPRKNYDMTKQLSVIVDALKTFDLDVSLSGRNDILLGDRKISGHAYYYSGQSAYHHGTLMVDINIDDLAKYLSPSKAKMAARGVESVRSRVINLKTIKPDITTESIMEQVVVAFSKSYGEPSETIVYDGNEAELKPLIDKYSSWDIRYGKTPEFEVVLNKKFSWGEIEWYLNSTKDAIIDSSVFYTDAMNQRLFRDISKNLIGCPLRKQDMMSAIGSTTVEGLEDSGILSDITKYVYDAEI